MLGQVAAGEPVASTLKLLGRGDPNSPTRDWQLWMTEYNLLQPSGTKDPGGNDGISVLQDMGHALVIADWTGHLLQQGVDRLAMFSLDHNPYFAQLQYDANNDPATDLAHPSVTAPGLAYAVYPQSFGQTLLRNTVANNPRLAAPNGMRYDKLGVYSSISADGRQLRTIVINRDLDRSASVQLKLLPVTGARRLAYGSATWQQLRSQQLTDTNYNGSGLVRWSAPATVFQAPGTGVLPLMLAPASVSLIVAPLQVK